MMACFWTTKRSFNLKRQSVSLSVTSYGRNIIIKRGWKVSILMSPQKEDKALHGFKLLYKQNGWVLMIQRVRLNTISVE